MSVIFVHISGIGGTQTYIMISTNFVAMPTPQNMTSLRPTACSVSGGFMKYSETINTFLPGQDFFYTQQDFDSKIFLVKYLTISLIKLIHAINYYILINV